MTAGLIAKQHVNGPTIVRITSSGLAILKHHRRLD
jgi:hypothetical protein